MPSQPGSPASITPPTASTRDLLNLPQPKTQIVAAVYSFRDQTGQYKPAPDSSFSTSVTQGATSMLMKALRDSNWFIPVERENLQDLLTERKIVRAVAEQQPKGQPPIVVPPLLAASVLIEGGVLAYESNVRTGGIGARFLGIGLSTEYRVDQVTVGLRSIDTRTGAVLHTVSTTKTIYSYEVRPTVFKFVNAKDLVEFEAGITRNEPAQMCVREAIEAAVIHLIVHGLQDHAWALANDKDWYSPVLQHYAKEEQQARLAGVKMTLPEQQERAQ
jgi:curli production assembly/transport component CsgG